MANTLAETHRIPLKYLYPYIENEHMVSSIPFALLKWLFLDTHYEKRMIVGRWENMWLNNMRKAMNSLFHCQETMLKETRGKIICHLHDKQVKKMIQ